MTFQLVFNDYLMIYLCRFIIILMFQKFNDFRRNERWYFQGCGNVTQPEPVRNQCSATWTYVFLRFRQRHTTKTITTATLQIKKQTGASPQQHWKQQSKQELSHSNTGNQQKKQDLHHSTTINQKASRSFTTKTQQKTKATKV